LKGRLFIQSIFDGCRIFCLSVLLAIPFFEIFLNYARVNFLKNRNLSFQFGWKYLFPENSVNFYFVFLQNFINFDGKTLFVDVEISNFISMPMFTTNKIFHSV